MSRRSLYLQSWHQYSNRRSKSYTLTAVSNGTRQYTTLYCNGWARELIVSMHAMSSFKEQTTSCQNVKICTYICIYIYVCQLVNYRLRFLARTGGILQLHRADFKKRKKEKKTKFNIFLFIGLIYTGYIPRHICTYEGYV